MDKNRKRKDPDFPMPPSLGIDNKNQQASDLMNRLKAFLPEMKAANQALSSESVGQVDIELKKDSDDENDSDSDNDSSNSSNDKIRQLEGKETLMKEPEGEAENDKDEKAAASGQMIQIQFALTDPSNPLVELFASEKEEESENENYSDRDDNQEDLSKVRVVKGMLKSTSSTKREETPKIRILNPDNRTPKKSLITEIS